MSPQDFGATVEDAEVAAFEKKKLSTNFSSETNSSTLTHNAPARDWAEVCYDKQEKEMTVKYLQRGRSSPSAHRNPTSAVSKHVCACVYVCV